MQETESEPMPVADLMAALEATLANVREGRDARAEREEEKEETKSR